MCSLFDIVWDNRKLKIFHRNYFVYTLFINSTDLLFILHLTEIDNVYIFSKTKLVRKFLDIIMKIANDSELKESVQII